ncbi:MAG: hypothetical protein FJY86_03530 [Candidatus Diapherotrites archaeon]|uniref:Uncharacterized protein n=1 Tax=Candidatus Iainarchaeum sp. TaxID=3101447 RepID=A0A8T4C733_9ARCH|nr:hypothetical protein [Candidatus Diapherotrites archaeon]
MPNQEAIIANIRKLEGMGLHGEELIKQLESMGIPRTQAERWIREANQTSGEIDLSTMNNRPTRQTNSTRTITIPIPANENKITNENPRVSSAYVSPNPPSSPLATEKLWEKGILSTVDAKLGQMERLKKELDDVIETRIQAHYDSMEKKLEALFEAQRELYKFKMDAQLDAKTKEVEEILDQKINDIKTLNLSTQEDLQRIKGQKMIIEDMAKEFSEKTSNLETTKKAILQDVGEKLEELETKVNELMSETESRVQNVENRATKTLELEEKITSNLSVQMEEQANKIVEEKVEDLRMEIKKEIVELKKLGADLASKDIQEVVQEFKDMNTTLEKTKKGIDELLEQKTRDIDKAMDQKLNSIDKIVNTKMETIVNEKEQSFSKKVEVQSMDVNSLKRELGQKLLETETRMQALDGFQKQFLETLKKSNAEREDLMSTLKKKIDTFDARMDEKISIVDQRLKQLDVVVGELGNLLMQLKSQQANASAAAQPPTLPPGPAPTPSGKKQGFNPFGK